MRIYFINGCQTEKMVVSGPDGKPLRVTEKFSRWIPEKPSEFREVLELAKKSIKRGILIKMGEYAARVITEIKDDSMSGNNPTYFDYIYYKDEDEKWMNEQADKWIEKEVE